MLLAPGGGFSAVASGDYQVVDKFRTTPRQSPPYEILMGGLPLARGLDAPRPGDRFSTTSSTQPICQARWSSNSSFRHRPGSISDRGTNGPVPSLPLTEPAW